MSTHPLNLTLRFALEIAVLVVLAWWGWQAAAPARIGSLILAVLLPLVAATMWGVFRVPGDGTSKGDAPVAVPGAVRLLLEMIFFGAAVALLVEAGQQRPALILAAVTAAHYALSLDRVDWLLRARG